MTQSQSKIPFHNLTFYDDLPKMRDVEARLKTFLESTRKRAQRIEIETGRMAEEDRVYPYDLVGDADMGRIRRRAIYGSSNASSFQPACITSAMRTVSGLHPSEAGCQWPASPPSTRLTRSRRRCTPRCRGWHRQLKLCGTDYAHRRAGGCGSLRSFWSVPLGSARAIGLAVLRITLPCQRP